ncbi:MAG TPA: PepSY-like domain-containing protein [Chitinophagaceae bacterium]|nr:PepSY-like domain-containing protein [Chitinophagaceae bacterium]
MKNRLFSIAAAAAVIIAACGTPQNTTTISSTSSNPAYSIPDNLQTSFTTQYPNATNITWAAYDVAVVPIDWEMTGWTALDASDHAVSFDMDGQRYYAWYDSDGTWIGSTYVVNDYSKLPAAVQSVINTKYSGYTIQKVHQEMWKDQLAYEIKLKRTDDDKVKLIVDNQGNILKEKLKD